MIEDGTKGVSTESEATVRITINGEEFMNVEEVMDLLMLLIRLSENH